MNKVELIAECSSNHGGDISLAKAFIHQYAEAGADWIKFQSYQVRTLRPGDPQRDWLAAAELSDDAHHILKAECEQAGVQFLTTVFHASRVPFLKTLQMPAIKVGSGEAAEMSVVDAVSGGWPCIFVSTGISPPNVLSAWDGRASGVRYFRCVSRYPCPSEAAYQQYFNRRVGWSDHCVGLEGCRVAIMGGARIIEKHVSLPQQKRERRSFEATVNDFKELRAFADDDPAQFIGRWQHGE